MEPALTQQMVRKQFQIAKVCLCVSYNGPLHGVDQTRQAKGKLPMCPWCQAFVHNPKRQEHCFSTIGLLNKHKRDNLVMSFNQFANHAFLHRLEFHCPWNEFELACLR
jgi:hypothetical protein